MVKETDKGLISIKTVIPSLDNGKVIRSSLETTSLRTETIFKVNLSKIN